MVGLTEGSRDSKEIALTDLGRSVVYPQSAREVVAAKVSAFRNVKLFNDVLEYYKGNQLPELQFLKNTLIRSFHLDEAQHEEFVKVFKENCEYVGLKEGQLLADLEGERRKTPDDSGQTVTIAGDPGTGLTCFIAMPFSERDPKRPPKFFSEVLARLITVAVQAAGFRVVTADRRGSDMIHATIVNDLLDADLVVADLTDHNPNVLFELGMRMHLDKPIALIQAEGTTRIFDVDNGGVHGDIRSPILGGRRGRSQLVLAVLRDVERVVRRRDPSPRADLDLRRAQHQLLTQARTDDRERKRRVSVHRRSPEDLA